jgi:hypothetical protein
VTVRYSTVWITLAVILTLAIGGTWAVVRLRGKDEREARDELKRAQDMRGQAAPLARDKQLLALLQEVDGKIAEAQHEFDGRDYGDSRTASIVAQNGAQRLMDLGKGANTASGSVRFNRMDGDVRVKRSGEFHWEAATPKMLLKVGDQIKTSGDAVVELIYVDGAMTTLKPGSLLEIKELSQEPISGARAVREKLSWGQLEATTRKADVEGSYHEVSTDSLSARTSDDAQFEVKSEEGTGNTSIDVTSGPLEVRAGSRSLQLGNFERVTTNNGILSEIEKIPMIPRLIQPPDQKVFTYTRPEDARATLVWEKVDQAARYRLQVSEKWLFTDTIVDDDRLEKTSVELNGLNPAGYYWRVYAVDAKGRPGPSSPVRRFKVNVGRLQAGADSVPPKLVVGKPVLTGQILILSGTTEPGATVWVEGERVDVNDSGAFTSVVRMKQEGTNVVHLVAQDAAGNETTRDEKVFVETF